jgi:hypothetical protein
MKVDYFPMFSTSVCGDVAGIIFTEGTQFIICTRLQIPKEIIFFVQAAPVQESCQQQEDMT